MAGLYELRSQLLRDDEITDDEVDVIRQHVVADGKLDLTDVKFLVELLSEAKSVCPAFDDLFFPALKAVLLEDDVIGPDEQYYLLKMLYSDGHVRDSEKAFLQELLEESAEVSPEFRTLVQTAMTVDAKNWDVGGRPTRTR